MTLSRFKDNSSKKTLTNLSYIYLFCKKALRIGIISKAGRNNAGVICVAHRRGRIRHYYLIDFFRRVNAFGNVYKVIKDLYRTAYIGGVFYENGLFSYIVLTEGVRSGYRVYSGNQKPADKTGLNQLNIGDSVNLQYIKLFTVVNNLELRPNSGAQLVRSAGSSALLIGKLDDNLMMVKLKSGWIVHLHKNVNACLGIVSNSNHRYNIIGKAGNSWKLGKRPKVRGVAMNPCDHPHGGGEGKKSPWAAPQSPWGWLTKGTPSKKKLKDKLKKKLYKQIR